MKSLRIATTAALVSFAFTSLGNEQSAFTFFVGTELNMVLKDEFHKVAGYQNKELQAVTGSQTLSVPLQKTQGLEISRSPKISSAYATLENISYEPVYSPAADPEIAWRNAVSAMQTQAKDAQDQVQGNAIMKMQAAALAGEDSSRVFSEAMSEIEASISETDRVSDIASDVPTNLSGQHDAVALHLTLSCSEELEKPYLVVLARYQNENSSEILLKPIFQEITGPLFDPREFKVYSAGFPLGFTLLDATVLLFDQGREIATNHSEKQAAVTRDQALTYLRFARKNENPMRDLGAAPIQGFTPAGFRDALSTEVLDQVVNVSVNSGGEITDIASPSGALSADIESMIHQIPFYPALREGQPIESDAQLALGELLQ